MINEANAQARSISMELYNSLANDGDGDGGGCNYNCDSTPLPVTRLTSLLSVVGVNMPHCSLV